MLITFQSKASSDVLMLASHAQELLGAMGKEAEKTEGVFTVEQVEAALAALDHYVSDYDQRHPRAPEENIDPKDDEAPGAAVPMRARAQPLMEMLRRAAEHATFVTWQTQA